VTLLLVSHMKHQKVSGQPAPVLVEAGAGVQVPELHHQNFTPTHKPGCQQRRWPSESLLELGSNAERRSRFTGRRYWARFAAFGYVPLNRKLLPKKSDSKHSF
jgi:hypothetical protein